MYKYIVKRVLWFIPTLVLLAHAIFFLSKSTGKDEAEWLLEAQGITSETHFDYEKRYAEQYLKSNLHLPVYYLSLLPDHHSVPVRSIPYWSARNRINRFYNGGYTYDHMLAFDRIIERSEDSMKIDPGNMTPDELLDSRLAGELTETQRNGIESLTKDKTVYHLPVLRWNGANCQFHNWWTKAVRGDLGRSITDGLPIQTKVGSAFKWTLTLLLINVLALIFIGLPIVLYTVYRTNFLTRILESTSLVFYVIPIFWLATLTQVFLMNPDYGWQIFPFIQDSYDTQSTFGQVIGQMTSKYLPAVFCMILTDLAIFIRLLKANIHKELILPYARTAKSKGRSELFVLMKHVLPNSAAAIITAVIGSIPAFLAGSVIVEVVFNIPGMGRLILNSVQKADWNVVYFIVLLIGCATSFFYLIGDLVYKWLDPRIKFDTEK